MKRTSLYAVALTIALLAGACGSESEPATSTTEADSAMDMQGMDVQGMNMGDASATRADEVDGAALATCDFMLLDTRPVCFDDMTGTAWIARHP